MKGMHLTARAVAAGITAVYSLMSVGTLRKFIIAINKSNKENPFPDSPYCHDFKN